MPEIIPSREEEHQENMRQNKRCAKCDGYTKDPAHRCLVHRWDCPKAPDTYKPVRCENADRCIVANCPHRDEHAVKDRGGFHDCGSMRQISCGKTAHGVFLDGYCRPIINENKEESMPKASAVAVPPETANRIQNIAIALITDNPFNPRTYYNPEKVEELASSINQIGLIEVPLARLREGKYEVAYGGYRRRAFAKLNKNDPAKWPTMPLEIREMSDEQMALFALEENLKRQDMTPLDTARAIDKYMETFVGTTEQELAEKLSMTQGNLSNMRRVLRLPKEVLEKINEGKINFTMGRELCVLQGLNAGQTAEWHRGEEVKVPRDDKYLMLEAIRKIGGTSYGSNPATVNGIKKSIYEVMESHFHSLDKEVYSYGKQTLFDVKEAGCAKCAKMIKGNRTQSQTVNFCTDEKCWNQKMQEHRDRIAAEAQAKLTADMAKRALKSVEKLSKNVRESVKNLPEKTENISQEISAPSPAEQKLTKKDRDALEQLQQEAELASPEAVQARRRRLEIGDKKDHPCLKCADIGRCNGEHLEHKFKDGTCESYYICTRQKLAETPQEVTKKATVKIPEKLLEGIKEKAGTRAEILDLYGLRVGGSWSNELTQGHVLLDGIMDRMANPKECIEECTHGFHYAFDSRNNTERSYFVCTDTKCCARKKAEFTRAKNARGMLKKKAEGEAIKQVVAGTTTLDTPRLKLIILANLMGRHVSNHYSFNNANVAQDWLQKRLKIEPPSDPHLHGEAFKKQVAHALADAFVRLPYAEQCQLLTEFMLEQLRYEGDIEHYQIRTTEVLEGFGVNIQLPPEAADPVPGAEDVLEGEDEDFIDEEDDNEEE